MKQGWLWLGIFFAIISTAGAWDPIGHMIVNQQAYNQLTPAAKARIDESLAEFNKKEHATYTFVTAGCWMDDIRGKTKEFNTWHYINLPYTPDGLPLPATSEQNVLWGINMCLGILKGEKMYLGIDKNQALVMLSHLVGDAHQPLHATSRNNDLGGNKVEVPNLMDAMVATFPNRKNLHTFWDSAYRRTIKDGMAIEEYIEPPYLLSQPVEGHTATLPVVVEKTALLEKAYTPDQYPVAGAPEAWVTESHKLGYTAGYQQLPGGDASNPVTLDATYVDTARGVAQQRLIQGGNRLAALLNEIYK